VSEEGSRRKAVDETLVTFPADLPDLIRDIGKGRALKGYHAWKVARGTLNWLQWNDGTLTPMLIANTRGAPKRWKLFTRLTHRPSGLWEPVRYKPQRRTIGGPDVWGCSYEALAAHLTDATELKAQLTRDLTKAYDYASEQYGR